MESQSTLPIPSAEEMKLPPSMESLSKCLRAQEKEFMEDNKIYVAVGKNAEEREEILNWAIKISRGETICVIHVHVPAQMIPLPNDCKAPVVSVQEADVRAFQEHERQEVVNMLDDCVQICNLEQISSETIYIETESITDGILELIFQLRIAKLVIGAGAKNRCSRRMTTPLSKMANYLLQHAPNFCHIWCVGKGLIYTRNGMKKPTSYVEEKSPNISDYDRPSAGSLSQESSSGLRYVSFSGYEDSSDEFDRSPKFSFRSTTSSLEAESAFSSPYLSSQREEIRDSDLELLTLPRIENKYQEESCMIDDVCGKLKQTMTQAENLKQDTFEQSKRCQKAEKEALVVTRQVKAAQKLYFEEFRQRKIIKEELADRKKEFEATRSIFGKVKAAQKLCFDHKLLLENQLKKVSLSEKEMEEKLLSAVDLLQKYKNYCDEFEVERDNALQEAKELRKQLALGPSRSHVHMFSEFSFSDIEIATNYFDPSLKIGGGGHGSTYRGFLQHSLVAIKLYNFKTILEARDFEQEVDVLSNLRHPNLVNLIGVCPKSRALVYEYLPRGSLEDLLICKGNSPPLPWQTRIQIALQLCSVLIFLHSSQPSSIIHGNIKSANILLDDNFVCKLCDFGVGHIISKCNISVEQTAELMGTHAYIDPDFLATGELTPKSDIYSFGILLLYLLTGKSALGISKEVKYAVDNGDLNALLDPSAGNWPFVQAEQLARLALRCCNMNQSNRPDLESDIWRVLEPMKASSQQLSTLRLHSDDQAPYYFICPIFQEIMEDPHIASDGFTYEAEAVRGWLDSGHNTSPMTNLELATRDLIPNRALRSAIQEWLQHRRSM